MDDQLSPVSIECVQSNQLWYLHVNVSPTIAILIYFGSMSQILVQKSTPTLQGQNRMSVQNQFTHSIKVSNLKSQKNGVELEFEIIKYLDFSFTRKTLNLHYQNDLNKKFW